MRSFAPFPLTVLTLLGTIANARPTPAQIVPDRASDGSHYRSLGTVVNGNPNFQITGGTTAGRNLFHSFRQFSVPTGGSAVFLNSPTIENIFSRVTGGNPSLINGLIGAWGTANLFLINPAGITFGSEASLRLGGSFFATTADRLIFEDGVRLEARDTTEPPLLTLNAPIGLDFSQNSGMIRAEGTGHGVNTRGVQVDLSSATPHLSVQSGNTLALIGGTIQLDGSLLSAESGRVELVALQNGQVLLNPLSSQVANVREFGDITLTNRGGVDASGEPGGSIAIAGRTIALQENSLGAIANSGNSPAGRLRIEASESFNLLGSDTPENKGSLLYSSALAEGNGSTLEIIAPQITITNGSDIRMNTFGQGNGGQLILEAVTVEIEERRASGSIMGLNLITGGEGRSGDIAIDTQTLRIINGPRITNSVFPGATGEGGDIRINAGAAIEIRDVQSETGAIADINTSSLSSSDAGSITIDTPRLMLQNGGRVGSGTTAQGDAGTVTITTNHLEIRGKGDALPSAVFSEALNPEDLEADGVRDLPPGLEAIASGNSGKLIITATDIHLSDGAEISVANDGTGSAGNILIDARTISLNTNASITAATASGEGGNIELQVAETLLLRRGSFISTEAQGTGNGGNLTIESANGFITALSRENSDIIANAFEGDGGQISINALGIYGLEFREDLTPLSDISASSQFGVSGTVSISNPNVNPAQINAELEGEVLDPNEQVVQGCGEVGESRFVVTGRGGVPENPRLRRSGPNTWHDIRDPSPYREQTTTAPGEAIASLQPAPLIEANAARRLPDGTIELYAVVPLTLPSLHQDTCP